MPSTQTHQGGSKEDDATTGDDPPRDRTSELRAWGFPGRHLGPVQMTTDTALGVTKIVVQDQSEYALWHHVGLTADARIRAVPLSKIPFIVRLIFFWICELFFLM